MSRIVRGAEMIGVELHDHQVDLGRILDGGEETTAIQWPRRAGKTTAVWSWLLGRCELEPDTLIVVTAQSGIKARDRFLSIARELERHYAEEDGGPRIRRGAGDMALEWANGSRLWVVAPKGEAFRGDAADVVYGDEFQELAPAESLEVRAAALPLMDTRPNGQIVLSGTPGRTRGGWFWEALQLAQDGAEGVVGSIYAADPSDDWDDEEVWQRVHPGLKAGMTKLSTIRARRDAMPALDFAMEYLGIWPGTDETRAIPELAWKSSLDEVMPSLPKVFTLGFDVAPDDATSAVAAAWRDDDGKAHVMVLEYLDGPDVSKVVADIWRKHRPVVAVDEVGSNLGPAETLDRGKVKLTRLRTRERMAADQLLLTAITSGDFIHHDQPPLNEAAEAAAWRQLPESGRVFGRRASEADISPLVAASVALFAYDRKPHATTGVLSARW